MARQKLGNSSVATQPGGRIETAVKLPTAESIIGGEYRTGTDVPSFDDAVVANPSLELDMTGPNAYAASVAAAGVAGGKALNQIANDFVSYNAVAEGVDAQTAKEQNSYDVLEAAKVALTVDGYKNEGWTVPELETYETAELANVYSASDEKFSSRYNRPSEKRDEDFKTRREAAKIDRWNNFWKVAEFGALRDSLVRESENMIQSGNIAGQRGDTDALMAALQQPYEISKDKNVIAALGLPETMALANATQASILKAFYVAAYQNKNNEAIVKITTGLLDMVKSDVFKGYDYDGNGIISEGELEQSRSEAISNIEAEAQLVQQLQNNKDVTNTNEIIYKLASDPTYNISQTGIESKIKSPSQRLRALNASQEKQKKIATANEVDFIINSNVSDGNIQLRSVFQQAKDPNATYASIREINPSPEGRSAIVRATVSIKKLPDDAINEIFNDARLTIPPEPNLALKTTSPEEYAAQLQNREAAKLKANNAYSDMNIAMNDEVNGDYYKAIFAEERLNVMDWNSNTDVSAIRNTNDRTSTETLQIANDWFKDKDENKMLPVENAWQAVVDYNNLSSDTPMPPAFIRDYESMTTLLIEKRRHPKVAHNGAVSRLSSSYGEGPFGRVIKDAPSNKGISNDSAMEQIMQNKDIQASLIDVENEEAMLAFAGYKDNVYQARISVRYGSESITIPLLNDEQWETEKSYRLLKNGVPKNATIREVNDAYKAAAHLSQQKAAKTQTPALTEEWIALNKEWDDDFGLIGKQAFVRWFDKRVSDKHEARAAYITKRLQELRTKHGYR